MIRISSSGNITVAKCFIGLLLFLLCACNEKPKESTTPQTVEPDTSSARGGTERMENTLSSEGDNDLFPGSSAEDLQLNIYPNPARDNFYLELNHVAGDMRYFILSNQGPIVSYGDIKSPKEYIDISKLEDGIYVVKVISQYKETPLVARLVVQN